MLLNLTPLLLGTRVMRRFNRSFPPFYRRFVSSRIQTQNLRLAYRLYETGRAVLEMSDEADRTMVMFVFRNQPWLLERVFEALAELSILVQGVFLYGQIAPPQFVFLHVVVSFQAQPVPAPLKVKLQSLLFETKSLPQDPGSGLSQLKVHAFVDPVFHLSALAIEADNEPKLFHKVMYALARHKVRVVGLQLSQQRDKTKFIFYLPDPLAGVEDVIAASLRTEPSSAQQLG